MYFRPSFSSSSESSCWLGGWWFTFYRQYSYELLYLSINVIISSSYPVYSFFLPVYSFWCMDEFGWGNTRLVIGEGKDKKVIINEDEKFDDSMIPLKKFSGAFFSYPACVYLYFTPQNMRLRHGKPAHAILKKLDIVANRALALVPGHHSPAEGHRIPISRRLSRETIIAIRTSPSTMARRLVLVRSSPFPTCPNVAPWTNRRLDRRNYRSCPLPAGLALSRARTMGRCL